MSGVYRSWCQPREVLRRCRLSTCTPCASNPSTAGTSSFAAAAQIDNLSGSYLDSIVKSGAAQSSAAKHGASMPLHHPNTGCVEELARNAGLRAVQQRP